MARDRSEPATITEWRLAHMDRPKFDRTSSTYPERRFVEEIQEVRGGVIQRRTVTEWTDDA